MRGSTKKFRTKSNCKKQRWSIQRWLLSGVKRNFWLHTMCASTEWYSAYQIPKEKWWLGLRV